MKTLQVYIKWRDTMDVLRGGRGLRQARERLKMTQPQLSDEAGVPQKTISRLERGEIVDPGIGLLLQVGQALSLSLEDLKRMYVL